MDNNNKNKKKIKLKNLAIIGLSLLALIFTIIIILSLLGIFNLKAIVNDSQNRFDEVDDEELLVVGRNLYDRANSIFEIWEVVPYCGLEFEEIFKIEKINFTDDINKQGYYYKSNFVSLDSLKLWLNKWFSNDIINKKINEKALSDVNKIDLYTSYVEQNNVLYCRSVFNFDKATNSKFLGDYDLSIKSKTNDSVIYSVRLPYIKENAITNNSKCWNDKEINISNCLPEEIEYKENEFIIVKNNSGNYIIDKFIFHD